MARVRRWRYGDGEVLPTTISASDLEILDTQEQEDLVRTFERRDKVQSFLWRSIFAAFSVALALFFVHSAHQQLAYPWGVKYHAIFSSTIKSSQVVWADIAGGVISSCIAVGVFKSHRPMLLAALISGLLLACFWLPHLNRLHTFEWQFLWLPFGTPSLAAICLYINRVLAETAQDIQMLRASMYHYKKS